MKQSAILFMTILFMACGGKKAETEATNDSTAVDSTMLATTPAPSVLAFNPVAGYTVDGKLNLPDSTNYFLFASQEEMAKVFGKDKGVDASSPDFIVNYVVAVAFPATKKQTSIVMDKVQAGGSSIDVYLTIQRGAEGAVTSKPSQIFVIERRDGYTTMQFFINGRMDKALVLI